uniref:Protein tyrosine phosphatase n=1 Tax=Solibacter usitatus (strain Ellin6076) TaxID=234267 RepID=Q01RB5_SOLUE
MNERLKSSFRILAAIVATSLAIMAAAAQGTQPKSEANSSTVVFVCEHGAAKSVIAAAHFNKLARERGLPFRAVSRGTKPEDAVANGVRTGLASDGLDVSNWRPTAVSDQDLRQAAQIVSLGTDLPKTKPFIKDKLAEWNDIPPVSENYAVARTAIVEQVRKLLDTLSAPKKP